MADNNKDRWDDWDDDGWSDTWNDNDDKKPMNTLMKIAARIMSDPDKQTNVKIGVNGMSATFEAEGNEPGKIAAIGHLIYAFSTEGDESRNSLSIDELTSCALGYASLLDQCNKDGNLTAIQRKDPAVHKDESFPKGIDKTLWD